MSNTKIQIKRSTTTATPAGGSLSTGELAHSYSSNVLFIGTSDGSGVLPVGGSFYVEKTNTAVTIASAAFDAANSAGSSAVVGAAYDQANSAQTIAIAAFAQGNNLAGAVNTTNTIAIAAFDKANDAQTIAVSAFTNSNTKLSANGGTISGDLAITGNLTITGNTVFKDVETFKVSDPLIYLAANNLGADIVDIGFIGIYANSTGSNVYTGFFRNSQDKEYYLFSGYDQEPVDNNINPAGNNFTISVLNADIKTNNLVLNGTNTTLWITSAFDKANAANYFAFLVDANTTAAFSQANSAQTISIAAFNKANSSAETVNMANASGVLAISNGGTGNTTFTSKGILFGNGTGAVLVTAAGTEGKVLQADDTGTPVFSDLDGGSF
jgi:hypothetical protein